MMIKTRLIWFVLGIVVRVFGQTMVQYVYRRYTTSQIVSVPSEQASVSGDAFSLQYTQQTMEELLELISENYYKTGDVDIAKMSRNAMVAFVAGLGDPFTSYLPPVETEELENTISGTETLEGIGAVLSNTEQGIMIQEVLPSSPAQQAGIEPLDIILSVDGIDVQSELVYEVVQKIRGVAGTSVELTIARRDRTSDTIDILQKIVVRDKIIVPSVSSRVLTGDHGQPIGLITLSTFALDTKQRLHEAISELLDHKIQGVILDLRGNGGGLLTEAVEVASYFLPKYDIVTNVSYVHNDKAVYKTEGRNLLSDLPVVVLVNRFSASASEIIALALRENRCYNSIGLSVQESGSGSFLSPDCSMVILGERTFGKGTIQLLKNLHFGGSLKLTIGERTSPTGISIHGTGILPDYVMPVQTGSVYYETSIEQATTLLSDYLKK